MGKVILWPDRGQALHRGDGDTEGYDLAGATVLDVPAEFSWQGQCVDWEALAVVADLAAERARIWAAVKAARDACAAAGCETALGRADSDERSRILIAGAVQMAQIAQAAGEPYSVDWVMADNQPVTHDAPAMIALGLAVGQHIAGCWERAQTLRAAIEAATTREQLDAIDVAAGWPGASE